MPRSTKTITFSLSPAVADRLDQLMKQQGRSRSELVREALLRYIEECEWRELTQYGERRAKALDIGPDHVSPLVEEYRAGVRPLGHEKVR